jgi:hypothetical protein
VFVAGKILVISYVAISLYFQLVTTCQLQLAINSYLQALCGVRSAFPQTQPLGAVVCYASDGSAPPVAYTGTNQGPCSRAGGRALAFSPHSRCELHRIALTGLVDRRPPPHGCMARPFNWRTVADLTFQPRQLGHTKMQRVPDFAVMWTATAAARALQIE